MLELGFKRAKEIAKRNAHTFYLASFFLAKEKRRAAYAIYAICHLSDESVDNVQLTLGQKQKEFDSVRKKINQAFNANEIQDPLLQAFRQTIQQYRIPQKYFDELLDGMSMDLVKNRYQNFDELYLYSYRVAGVIGLIMIKIFEYKDAAAEQCALDLGLALQLTNILRDIKEDFARGRIYLPQDEMSQCQIDENDIKNEIVDKNFKDFMNFQIRRARGYFYKASHGITLIKNPRCQFVTFLILEFYAKILKKIENNNFNIYSRQAFVPVMEKIYILFYLVYRFIKKDFIFKV